MENLFFGVVPGKIDFRDYKIRYKNIATAVNFPEQFELSLSRAKQQGMVGSCVAFSLSLVFEYFNNKETGTNTTMSTSYIYGNRRNSNWKKPGMRTREALKNACEYGDVSKDLMPKNIEVPNAITYFEENISELKEKGRVNCFKKFFKITSANAMKECLMNYGPILVVVKWYNNSQIDRQGILNFNVSKKNYNSQHCMVCYGWNKDGWKIQNSWGPGWGKLGRAILPFNTDFVEVWGIIDQENIKDKNLEIITPYNNSIAASIIKGVNSIANFITGRK